MLGDLCGFGREAPAEVATDATLRQHAGAIGRDPQQVGSTERVDALEGVKDGRYQHRAAIVRLGRVSVVGRRGIEGVPATVLVFASNHVPESAAVPPQSLTELGGEFAEHKDLLVHPPASVV